MAEIVHTEQVREGEKARYPFKSEYEEPTLDSYLFVGWKYKGTIYEPNQYASEASNPFGPITENTDILAMWSQVRVFCIPDKTIIGYEGGQIKIMYYAVTSRVVTSNDVEKQFIPPRVNPIQYSVVSDTEVSGQYRMCTINVTQNNDDEGRKIRVAATYKGVMSDVVEIYQQSPHEFIIPDCDYFIFNYEWEYDDKETSTSTDDTGGGKDLDSLTIIYLQDSNGNKIQKSYTGIPLGYRSEIINNTGTRETVSVYKDGQTNYFMRWGGDNRLSGAEGAIICLTNIAKYGEVSNLDTVIIEIYANWFSRRIDGNMKINCMGYKSKEGSSGKYSDEIKEIEHINPKGNYKTFEPNTDNCEVSWEGFSESLNIKAAGSLNASYEDAFIPYLDKLYSKVCTVTYDIGSGNKSYIGRGNVDNGRNSTTPGFVTFKTDDNNKQHYELNNQQQTFVCSGIYVTYDNTDYYMFDNENDTIKVRVYLNGTHKSDENITITTSELGQSYNGPFFSNLRFTRESNNKLRLSIDFPSNPNNDVRNLDIIMLKCIGDNIHPAIEIPGHATGMNIYQKEN